MRRAATILCIFFLGVLIGSVFIVPGTGDSNWLMGDIEAVGARVGVYPGPDGMDVSELLDRIVDRLMKCCPNVAPDAVDDDIRTTPGDGIFIDVLANDTDLDRDALSIIALYPPLAGSAVIDRNRIHYVPPSNMTGWDHFEYEIEDGHGGTSRAKVAVAVESGPILSEIEMDPAEDDEGAQWIEIYNGSYDTASLEGWSVSITNNCADGEGACLVPFPDGASIGPWSHYVFALEGTSLDNSNGWSIHLLDAEGRIVDRTPAGQKDTADNYMTWQRVPNGMLEESAWKLTPQTRGTDNR